jgi:hypothetical protein
MPALRVGQAFFHRATRREVLMLKTYIRRHSDGHMQSVSRGMRPAEAIAEYRRLLARDDLTDKPWSAILRDDLTRRTLLFSRFDLPEQRLLPSDVVDFEAVFLSDDADTATRVIVNARR